MNDIFDAFDRYEDFTGNKATPLATRIDKAIGAIETSPLYRVNDDYPGEVRSVGIENHSYRLYYRISKNELEIIAFAFESHRQNPARIINEVNRRIKRLDLNKEELIEFGGMSG
jgi:hypothetical protein